MNGEPLLEVKGLEVRFHARKKAVARAVDGIDLTVREGEDRLDRLLGHRRKGGSRAR